MKRLSRGGYFLSLLGAAVIFGFGKAMLQAHAPIVGWTTLVVALVGAAWAARLRMRDIGQLQGAFLWLVPPIAIYRLVALPADFSIYNKRDRTMTAVTWICGGLAALFVAAIALPRIDVGSEDESRDPWTVAIEELGATNPSPGFMKAQVAAWSMAHKLHPAMFDENSQWKKKLADYLREERRRPERAKFFTDPAWPILITVEFMAKNRLLNPDGSSRVS